MTGGRLKRAVQYLEGDDTFCLTYGDGVGDVDIAASIDFHRNHGKLATVTAVRPLSRFGQLALDGDRVTNFAEKPAAAPAGSTAAFSSLSRAVERYIDGDATTWEREPLERLASEDNLRAFYHQGFWQPMDTLRDKNQLEAMWVSGSAPWRSW